MRISDWSSDVCSSDLLADHPIAAQYRQAAGEVFKLSDIAWPVVRFEQHDRGGVELLAGQPRLGGAIEEVSCEQGDVLTPFAQCRQRDRHNVEPVEQILAEPSVGDSAGEVAIGGGDDADIGADRPSAADGDRKSTRLNSSH